MRSAFLLASAAAIVLCSCTPPVKYPAQAKGPGQQAAVPAEPPVQRARAAYLGATAQDPVKCTVGADCTDKWSHALAWVNTHSQYSVKTNTDIEISTLGPIEPTTDAAFTITRTPIDGNTMAINFSASCGEKQPACVPTVLELNADFKNYLLNGVTHGDY